MTDTRRHHDKVVEDLQSRETALLQQVNTLKADKQRLEETIFRLKRYGGRREREKGEEGDGEGGGRGREREREGEGKGEGGRGRGRKEEILCTVLCTPAVKG